MAHVMTAHARMRNSTHWSALKAILDKTDEGVEKYEMTRKMAIQPNRLDSAKNRLANFKRARRGYEEDYAKSLAEIEALTKACGRARIVDDGDSTMEKTVAGKKGWWNKKKASAHCNCGGEAKEAAVAKAVEDVINEKY